MKLQFLALAALVSCRAASRFESPLSTDRPGFLFASNVVPRGAFQVEAGAPNASWDRTRGDDDTSAALFVQTRYGLTDALELRVASTPVATAHTEPGASSSTDTGAGDIEIGAKCALAKSLATVLVGTVRLPTGEHPFTTEDPAYSLYAVSETALEHGFALKGMAGWSRTPDGSGDDFDAGALALLVGHAIAGDLGAYVETAWFPAFESGPEPAYAGFGLAYPLGLDAQLDVSVDGGINDDAIDWILSAGWSIRW